MTTLGESRDKIVEIRRDGSQQQTTEPEQAEATQIIASAFTAGQNSGSSQRMT
ncbi:MAG: hypothetical protein ACI8W8_001026 [Rhodothermales bacterium]|jgi:hypothetical protein